MRNYSSKEYFRDCTGTPFSAAYLLSAYLGTSICVRKGTAWWNCPCCLCCSLWYSENCEFNMSVWNEMDDETPIVTSHREKLKKKMMRLRSCFELFEMFFEVKNLQFLPASSVR